MYKTSYSKMSSQSPCERKNMAIPGYKGYIPGVKAEPAVGKRFSEQSREVLTKQGLDDKEAVLASTGFNIARITR
eukprot:CAMPEP_0202956802 /NCGR_PEP_ID=MMETSP1396-20130829/1303_1 /ASSEMBLY_ACC=CAM_ASM_000872 /TAXON_ID= /ORGANISM="Pseudokeronopsis sp., Strain Brazil" /LENGTH=74 /DNA_ID=CAMNT_0049673993 /DNA_START=96 /DNA_END=320 /DNA_ORIENTATION=+